MVVIANSPNAETKSKLNQTVGSTARLCLSPSTTLGLCLEMQAYKVLGHIDILGDPLSLGKSISSGVIGFVTKVRYEPA